MRCYLIKGGHIAAVEYLTKEEDSDLIAEAREVFETKGRPRGAQGFEVWVGRRFVYRDPPEEDSSLQAAFEEKPRQPMANPPDDEGPAASGGVG